MPAHACVVAGLVVELQLLSATLLWFLWSTHRTTRLMIDALCPQSVGHGLNASACQLYESHSAVASHTFVAVGRVSATQSESSAGS